MSRTENDQVPVSRALYGKRELARLIRPRSVAIVGASPTPGSFGCRSIENTAFGYSGKVFPVNPKYPEIGGHRCYASVDDIPETPDCVVLSVPRGQIVPLAEQCAARGVGGAVIYTSGFMETGDPEAMEQQHRLTAIARLSGMRILGPNCIGVMNFVDRVGITFQPGLDKLPMIAGPIGLVVQSGALGFSITQGMQRGVGFSYTLAPGNSCDVDVCDLINFLIEDESTKAIGCMFEGVHDGRRLLEVAHRALAAGKPLIVYKTGNNELSRRTALSHTGTLTGSLAAYRAAFDRAGMIVVQDLEAILETVSFFAVAGKPATRGVGVFSGSGGAAVMAADMADDVGLPLPPLAPRTAARMRERLPSFGSVSNPCDITTAAQRDKTLFEDSLRAFSEDPSFAAIVMPLTTVYLPTTAHRAETVCRVAGTLSKPICVVWMNEWYQGPGSDIYDRSREVSIFRSMRRCLTAVKAWVDYYDHRDKRLSAQAPRVTGQDCATRVGEFLLRRQSGEILSERESKQLLAIYGVPVTREKLATSAGEAMVLSGEIGYPVVLKAESAAIPHKTEAGVVRLRLGSGEEVRDAFNAIMAAASRLPEKPHVNGVLVQEMIGEGVEVMIGTRYDPQFGPLIVCGLGGVLVEILEDTACALAPIGKEQALAMLKSLKGYRLLTGFRGGKTANIGLLAETVARISELAADLGPRLAELDVNPVIAGDDHLVAVDALAVAGPH